MNVSIKIMIFCILLGVTVKSYAQVSTGGMPYSFSEENIIHAKATIPAFSLPQVNNDKLREYAADIVQDCEGCKKNYWGKGFDVDIDIIQAAQHHTLNNGLELWIYEIHSDNALGLQIYFDQFRIPKGAKLFIYNEDRSMVLGAFTSANNKRLGSFAIQPVSGNTLFIEYSEPADADFTGTLHIAKVIHDFKGVLKSVAASGSCNINVACPAGDGWENEMHSVAHILYYNASSNLTGLCSGTLLNNANNDGTPYFLTAAHCAEGTGLHTQYENWVFLFNFEAADCAGTTGPTTQSVSGSTLLATGTTSDYLLLLLNETPPVAYNVCYAGWDRSYTTSTAGITCIHHPSGDIKKITIDHSAPSMVNWSSSCSCYAFWRIATWDQGTTEDGSSGAAFFDDNHRVVGQLWGGFAACTNPTGYDEGGKFSFSWTSGNLGQWLDTNNTGVTAVDTYCPTITDVQPQPTDRVKIYPNPVSDELTIELNNKNEQADIEIRDILGRIVFTERITGNTIINTTPLPAGIYLINAGTGATQKLIKD